MTTLIREEKMHMVQRFIRSVIIWGLLLPATSQAQAVNPDATEQGAVSPAAGLSEMNLESLMELEVTSVSKRSQKVSDAPAAVFVITQDDIRRSGATSVPEVIRMAPGVEVARVDNLTWAVSTRGFNGRFANKLLVLIDGRSVYSPLFSGVFWDEQDLLLEDIERVEVIRGPGASLWGANAVNGVINIITKRADATTGGLVVAAAGFEAPQSTGLRYGVKMGNDTAGRIFVKYGAQDDSKDLAGNEMSDQWNKLHGGFRIDSKPGKNDSITLQGDIYRFENREIAGVVSPAPPYGATADTAVHTSGGNILARWGRTFSSRSDMAFQVYYDQRLTTSAILGHQHDTADMDFQHRFPLGERQEFIWGGGYREVRDRFENSFTASMDPSQRTTSVLSLFVQDDLTLVADRLHFIAGSKFERSTFSGFESQPNGRLLWTPNDRQSVWAAASRAVRTPSRSEEDFVLHQLAIPPGDPNNPGPVPVLVTVFGNEDFKSENLLAYELGYRIKATESATIDIATFYNVYNNLRTFEQGTPFLFSSATPYIVAPVVSGNTLEGRTYGIETAVDWHLSERWKLKAAYSYLKMKLHLIAGSQDTTSVGAEGETPLNQVSLLSSFDIRKSVEFDLWYRYIDSLPNLQVSAYSDLDARVAWKPRTDLELSLVAQNIFDHRHAEFKPEILTAHPGQIMRSVYVKAAWRF